MAIDLRHHSGIVPNGMLFVLILILMILSSVHCQAHPHVFVHNTATFVFDDKGLAGIRLRWVFDEMFGSSIIFDHDTNGNGCLEDDEVAVIKKEAFDHLKKYNYFTCITIDARPFKVEYVKDFMAKAENGTLVYTFLIPCHVLAVLKPKEIRVSVFDESYYTAIDMHPGRVKLDNPYGFVCEVNQGVNKDISYYYGQMNPDVITLRFWKKS